MIAGTAAGFVSAGLLGSLIVAVLWPRARPLRPDLGLILPVGVIVGLGVTSVIFFAASLITEHPAALGGAIELVALVTLAVAVRRRLVAVIPGPAAGPAPPSWWQWALATLLVQALAVGAVVAWRAFLTEPFGGWDGWAIWNLHARVLVRAGPDWADVLAAPQLSWAHPDYPKFVSASVARLWSWAGAETPAAAGLVSVALAAATVGVLVAGLARLRGRTPALVAGLLLAGTPFFLSFAPNQHADIPLASCMLAAVVLAALGGRWTLTGLCAGLAAWTKNEGLLFAAVFAAAGGWQAWRTGGCPGLARLLAGFAPGLGSVLWLKLALAPGNDLLAQPLGPRLAQLLDVTRHRMIAEALWHDLAGFGEWQVVPYLAMALPFVAWRGRSRLVAGARLLPAVILTMLAGFYLVYLLSPQDLRWHLDTSLVRLLLQLWPLALLLWGLTFPWNEPGQAGRAPRPTTMRVVFGIANALAATAIVVTLAGQLAANELAVKRDRAGTIRVMLGDGWFGREHRGRDTWAWSGGPATLDVQVGADQPAAAVTLRFALRSLGAREVTVRLGDRILWQRRGPDAFVPVEIADLVLPPGVTTLEVATDTPGLPETQHPGARALAFAIYNLKLM